MNVEEVETNDQDHDYNYDEANEWDDKWRDGDYVDQKTGQQLDPALARAARLEEISFMKTAQAVLFMLIVRTSCAYFSFLRAVPAGGLVPVVYSSAKLFRRHHYLAFGSAEALQCFGTPQGACEAFGLARPLGCEAFVSSFRLCCAIQCFDCLRIYCTCLQCS